MQANLFYTIQAQVQTRYMSFWCWVWDYLRAFLLKPNVPDRKTILGSQGRMKTKIWDGRILNFSRRLPEIPRPSDIKNFESAERILLEKILFNILRRFFIGPTFWIPESVGDSKKCLIKLRQNLVLGSQGVPRPSRSCGTPWDPRARFWRNGLSKLALGRLVRFSAWDDRLQ